MQTLSFSSGIVTDAYLNDIPIVTKLIASTGSSNNVRTCIALDAPVGVTIHNTGNDSPTADALAHAAWLASVEESDSDFIGAHFFVDAERIVQTLPTTEMAWHAGDGMGTGNRSTIAIEICETAPYAQAEANAMCLAAALLDTYGMDALYTHQMFSGKYCPRRILARAHGWDDFCRGVREQRQHWHAQAAPPTQDNTPSPWARSAVEWAVVNRLLVGDENGDLRLHAAVTRQELVAILERMAQKGGWA